VQTRQVYNLEKIKILHTGKEKAISVIQAIKDKKKNTTPITSSIGSQIGKT
jgi:hypothetical protein